MNTETRDVVDLFNAFTRASCGFTEVRRVGSDVTISHGGNMGNGIDSVNRNLTGLNLPPIEKLRELFPGYKEEGSPDYMYTFRFTLPVDCTVDSIESLRSHIAERRHAELESRIEATRITIDSLIKQVGSADPSYKPLTRAKSAMGTALRRFSKHERGYCLLGDPDDRPRDLRGLDSRQYRQPERRLPLMPILILLVLVALLAAANLSATLYLILNK